MAKKRKLEIMHPVTKVKVGVEDSFAPVDLVCPKCMTSKITQIQITCNAEYVLQCGKCPGQTWLKKL